MLRIAGLDSNPGILSQLLETEGDAIALAVVLEHFYIDLVTDVDDFTRVLDPLPRHIRDMQQAVHASEINKRTIVGEVLDNALNRHTFLQLFEQSITFFAADRLQHCSARYHHVVTLSIQFDQAELQFLPLEMQRIANRSYIDQRPGQECPDVVKVDRESAFDFAVDHAGDNVIFLMRSFQLHPGFGAFRLLSR